MRLIVFFLASAPPLVLRLLRSTAIIREFSSSSPSSFEFTRCNYSSQPFKDVKAKKADPALNTAPNTVPQQTTKTTTKSENKSNNNNNSPSPKKENLATPNTTSPKGSIPPLRDTNKDPSQQKEKLQSIASLKSLAEKQPSPTKPNTNPNIPPPSQQKPSNHPHRRNTIANISKLLLDDLPLDSTPNNNNTTKTKTNTNNNNSNNNYNKDNNSSKGNDGQPKITSRDLIDLVKSVTRNKPQQQSEEPRTTTTTTRESVLPEPAPVAESFGK